MLGERIKVSMLRAPAGLHDDRAHAYALAVAAVAWKPAVVGSAVGEQGDVLDEYDGGSW